MRHALRQLVGRLPVKRDGALWRRLRRVARPAWFGTLGATTPLSSEWGFDRGTPVDRHYIDAFLHAHRGDIRGRALEVKNSAYTDRFGTGVERRDVIDIDASNPRATIVADLAAADSVAADQFDCFVITQTLQFILDTRAAIAHAHRVLRPGGTLLATVPAVSRVAPRYGLDSDYWRFTAASCTALFAERFGAGQVTVTPYGNVASAIAFLAGVAHEELTRRQLDARDPYFPVIIGVRAVKGGGA
jgi:SAM-dependent methyltransferase